MFIGSPFRQVDEPARVLVPEGPLVGHPGPKGNQGLLNSLVVQVENPEVSITGGGGHGEQQGKADG